MTVVNKRAESFDTYIGRPGPWGNPFTMRNESERDAVCERHADWVLRQPWYIDSVVRELAGRRLGCFCAPKRCHGDTLSAIANEQWVNGAPVYRPVFVFGSNLAGRHGKGAALVAKKHYNAETGVGEGPTGWAYAIPTKDERLRTRSIDAITESIERFNAYARSSRTYPFLVTRVGCGLAGLDDTTIAPLFAELDNVYRPGVWQHQPRVLVTSGFRNTGERIDRLIAELETVEIVSGAGNTFEAEEYALKRGLGFSRFPRFPSETPSEHNARLIGYSTHVIAQTGGEPWRDDLVSQANAGGLKVRQLKG